jgi:endonuclease III
MPSRSETLSQHALTNVETIGVNQVRILKTTVNTRRVNRITNRLLLNASRLNAKPQSGFTNWLLPSNQRRLSKRNANKFLLGSILDYQIPGHVAWENARRLAEQILDDPTNLWEEVTSTSQSQWKRKWREYKLHRFPAAHERIWRIGKEIVLQYHGDAREIWENQNSEIVRRRLGNLRVGKQLSRMIVGSLIDSGHIRGSGDVKVDRHIRRVFGRLLIGRGFSEHEVDEVTIVTRRMYASNPWLLDWPLFVLATTVCTIRDPKCARCEFRNDCYYFSKRELNLLN